MEIPRENYLLLLHDAIGRDAIWPAEPMSAQDFVT